jgi:uncharacterized membrane protein
MHLATIVSFATALAAVLAVLVASPAPVLPVMSIAAAGATHPGQSGSLTTRELAMARTAWRYFQSNTQQQTGLVNAVDNYPSTTMWDTASYIGALVAARELGVIDKSEFDRRIAALIKTLSALPLFRGELPNKVYQTVTAEKADYANKPGEIGFSALDLGRLLIWLRIAKERYPEHADGIDRVVLRWNFCNVVDACGSMYGAQVNGNGEKATTYVQEGRLGYEEYAAKGFQLWGFDTTRASKLQPFDVKPIFGVPIAYDTRDPRTLGAHNYVVSENYILDGLELNWDTGGDRSVDDLTFSDVSIKELADRVYRVQQLRFERTGTLTARTEHQIEKAPYFVYDTVFSDGYAWNTIADDGTFQPDAAAVAVKGAMGLWVLWNGPYSKRLFDAVSGMFDTQKGFYEGIYENGKGPIRAFTANNNGIILECLLYKVQGKLLKFGASSPGLWEREVSDAANSRNTCLRAPQRKRECGR